MTTHADTARTPDSACRSGPERTPGLFARLSGAAGHREVGTLYLLFALFAGIVGGALSGLMRAELAEPGIQYLQHWAALAGGHGASLAQVERLWTLLVTAHGLVMIFFMVLPALIGGFGNWFVPLLIGAPDTAFPRLNAFAFWLMVPAFLLLLGSTLLPGVGPGAAVGLAIFALYLAGLSSILGAINFIVTILNLRTPEMTLHRMPLFVWSILVTSCLLLLSWPVLAAAVTLMLTDGGPGGLLRPQGDAEFYQRLFWFFGHPEISIMILPGFGIVSQIVATFSRRPVVGYFAMAYAMVALGIVGFIVWAQQMFLSGRTVDLSGYFALATLVLAVPTGVKLFGWAATLWGGAPRFPVPMLWALGFVVMLAVGGATGLGLLGGFAGLGGGDGIGDGAGRGGYAVVAHFHYVLSLGSVFALFAGFTYWFPKMTGRMGSEFLGQVHFWLFFVGANMTFFPMHFLGASGMARRAPDYAAAQAYWNGVSSLGFAVMAAGLAAFFANIAWAWLAGRRAPANPWGAGATSLEWTVPSPPPRACFAEPPRLD